MIDYRITIFEEKKKKKKVVTICFYSPILLEVFSPPTVLALPGASLCLVNLWSVTIWGRVFFLSVSVAVCVYFVWPCVHVCGIGQAGAELVCGEGEEGEEQGSHCHTEALERVHRPEGKAQRDIYYKYSGEQSILIPVQYYMAFFLPSELLLCAEVESNFF